MNKIALTSQNLVDDAFRTITSLNSKDKFKEIVNKRPVIVEEKNKFNYAITKILNEVVSNGDLDLIKSLYAKLKAYYC